MATDAALSSQNFAFANLGDNNNKKKRKKNEWRCLLSRFLMFSAFSVMDILLANVFLSQCKNIPYHLSEKYLTMFHKNVVF